MKRLAFSLALCGALFAADGDLDTGFNGTGTVMTPVGSSTDAGVSVAIQDDGKLVVAGYASNGSNDDFALARYNADGSLDGTFGSGGTVLTPVGSSSDYGYSVAIQSDGKLVVAGYASNGSNDDFALARYNADGSLDGTFGSGGTVLTPVGSGNDIGFSVAIQSDGKLVVAGYASNGSNNDFALARYNADGSLDGTFGSGGTVLTPVGSSNDIGQSVVIQDDGKLVVAGYASNGSNNDFALARYNADGSLDGTFGSGGTVLTPVGSSNDIGFSVAIQSDGKLVVAGYADNGSNIDFAVARYLADGFTNVPDITVTDSVAPDNDRWVPFGAVEVGSASPVQIVTVTNGGDGALTGITVSMAGTDSDEFQIITNGCGDSLEPGAVCEIEIAFVPTGVCSRSAELRIVSDDPDESVVSVILEGVVSGSGFGDTLRINGIVGTYFPMVPLMSTSAARTVSVFNASGAPLTLASVGLFGEDADRFDVATDFDTMNPFSESCGELPRVLPPYESCLLAVTFTPETAEFVVAQIGVFAEGVCAYRDVSGRGWDYGFSSFGPLRFGYRMR